MFFSKINVDVQIENIKSYVYVYHAHCRPNHAEMGLNFSFYSFNLAKLHEMHEAVVVFAQTTLFKPLLRIDGLKILNYVRKQNFE